MSNFIDEVIKNAKQQIKYSNTITTGEITKNNGDGTYSVKIANASSAVPEMGTLNYEDNFRIGEIVTVGFEFGCKESPRIFGHSKKIKQIPKPVEVDYSGEEGGGVQEETVIIYAENSSGVISAGDNSSAKCHDSVDGSDLLGFEIISDYIVLGEGHYVPPTTLEYGIDRGYIFFNTSIIPSNAIITKAILSFTIADNYDINWNIVLQNGQPNYPNNPLIASDYNCSKYSNNGGQMKAVAGEDPPVYSNITLNSNGMAWINKGGMTKFCLRSSGDIAGTFPALGSVNAILIDKETYPLKLTITYTI